MMAFTLTEVRTPFGRVIRHGAICMAILAVLILAGRFPAALSGRAHAADRAQRISIERFPSATVPGTLVVVRVRDAALAHTTQLFPDATNSTGAATQVSSLLAKLDAVIRNGDAARGSVVKLNVYVRDSAVPSERFRST